MPDANFYKACVPRSLRLPAFYNCGGRSDVLSVYRAVLERHHKDPANSYLAPEKLHALVDLDIQAAPLPEGYPWPTTEQVHAALYDDGVVKAMPDDRHRIWVTAFVHKEAFFILPSMSPCLSEGMLPFWNGMPLDLRAIHTALAKGLAHDGDVCRHFDTVKRRVARFSAGLRLACTDAACLGESWIDDATSANDDGYESLVKALLAVAKAKGRWNEVVPDPSYGSTMLAENFRDQLALKIGRFVATLEPNAHPLAGFFASLVPHR